MYTVHVYRGMYGTTVLLCSGDLWEQACGLASFKRDNFPHFNGPFIFSHVTVNAGVSDFTVANTV